MDLPKKAVVGGSGVLGLLAEVNSFEQGNVDIWSDSAVPVRVRRTGFRSILGEPVIWISCCWRTFQHLKRYWWGIYWNRLV